MFIVDVNVLLYAHDSDAPHHERARGWLEGQITARAPLGLPWATIVAFLRLTTAARIWKIPWTTEQSIEAVAHLLSHRATFVAHTTSLHWQLLGECISAGQARGNLVSDAHLAALAMEHGATLVTFDRDFARFRGLKQLNLLDVAA